VYYVDKSDVVAAFFADEVTVNKIIESRKEVSKSRWKFFQFDITHSITEIPEVDMVIALYGGDVLKNAIEKAKVKGYVLTASECSGEGFVRSDERYNRLYDIGFLSGEYKVLKGDGNPNAKKKAFTKGNVFRDTLRYGVYQRMR
jgi:hypothetical protein